MTVEQATEQPRPHAARPAGTGARRRPDRRRRPVRHRRRLPPAGGLPRQDVRDPGVARARSAAPGTCSATPASARTPTCSPSATRFRPWKDSKSIADGESIRRYIEDTAREYGVERANPLPPPGARRPTGPARTPAGRCTRAAHRHRRDGRADLLVAVGLLRLLPLRRGLPAGLRGRGELHRRSWSTRSTGPRTSTPPASGSSSSAAAPPRSRSCRASPTTPRT